MQFPILANNRLAIRRKANARVLALVAINREMARFTRYISESILEIERDGMLAIRDMDILQGRSKVVLITSPVINAIKVEIC